MNVLVTGGAGYIGSHACVELLNAGHSVVVVDNLVNANAECLRRVERITGKTLEYHEMDLLNRAALNELFDTHRFDCVLHFAGLKAVGESVQQPLRYYNNNLGTTIHLCQTMAAHGVKKILFSSSATVYSPDNTMPVDESARTGGCTNPYGWTKYMSEQILSDTAKADGEWTVMLLRYFNPVGAHPSGLIGEDPRGIPNNLMPYIAQTAAGRREYLSVFGNDYPTPDGTGVRDYIHVVDLARGHVAALDWMGGKVGTGEPSGLGSIQGEAQADGSRRGVGIFNLGTGKGSSVLDVIHAFERACGKTIPYEIKPRRAGDIATNYAACDKAQRELGWVAQYDLDRMCSDSWRWQSMNPDGYATKA